MRLLCPLAALLLAPSLCQGGGNGKPRRSKPTPIPNKPIPHPTPPGDPVVTPKAPVAGEVYNYGQVIQLSYLFYEAQRSGKLPKTNRIPWRGDSALQDGQDVDIDLSGGWYDAGDFVKFAFPMAFSATILNWGLIEYWDAYDKSGELQHALDGVRWPLDWLVKAHADNNTFYCQVGDGNVDHSYWGPPESMAMERPSFKVTDQEPGTEPVAEAAAALASGYLVFRDLDAAYAENLLTHARGLFDLGYNHQASFHISDPFYQSWSGFMDELAWAALWLYKATGEEDYLSKATELYPTCCSNAIGGGFSWENKQAGVQVLMHQATSDAKYAEDFGRYMDSWFNLQKTPMGLSYYQQWGANRYAANTAFLALMAADYQVVKDDKADDYRGYAISQIHYILGDCCGGVDPKTKQPFFSYIIGYGNSYPKAPHHRSASCSGTSQDTCTCSTKPSAHLLLGAMVGGPDDKDGYMDDCQDYTHNEVTTDYNAGITSAVAGLKHLSITGQLKTLPLPKVNPLPANQKPGPPPPLGGVRDEEEESAAGGAGSSPAAAVVQQATDDETHHNKPPPKHKPKPSPPAKQPDKKKNDKRPPKKGHMRR